MPHDIMMIWSIILGATIFCAVILCGLEMQNKHHIERLKITTGQCVCTPDSK